MDRFYWVIPGVLAGCSRPGGTNQRWRIPSAKDVGEDLAWLQRQGVRALVSLIEQPLPETALAPSEIDVLHIPVVDMQPPTAQQFTEALRFIDDHRARGEPVAVHCLMGQGRTGSILAAYMIRDGQTRDQALAELRVLCPNAVENKLQEAALDEFAMRRDWII
ncbi:MAG: dual specificity protein phosphatase family protein [Thermomicrobiales bacterium]